jgi:hypothetical protein
MSRFITAACGFAKRFIENTILNHTLNHIKPETHYQFYGTEKEETIVNPMDTMIPMTTQSGYMEERVNDYTEHYLDELVDGTDYTKYIDVIHLYPDIPSVEVDVVADVYLDVTHEEVYQKIESVEASEEVFVDVCLDDPPRIWYRDPCYFVGKEHEMYIPPHKNTYNRKSAYMIDSAMNMINYMIDILFIGHIGL